MFLTSLCNVTLPPGWQTNHHNADLSVLDLDTAAVSASSTCHDHQVSEYWLKGSQWLPGIM